MFKKLCEFNAFPSSKALLSCSIIPLISVLMWNHLSAFRCEDVRSRMIERARGATTATSRVAWPPLPPRLVWLAGSGPGARRMAAAAMADHMTKSRTMRRNSAIINNNNSSRHKNSNSGLPISSSTPSPSSSSSYRDFQKDGLWVARHRPRSQRIPSMWDHAT